MSLLQIGQVAGENAFDQNRHPATARAAVGVLAKEVFGGIDGIAELAGLLELGDALASSLVGFLDILTRPLRCPTPHRRSQQHEIAHKQGHPALPPRRCAHDQPPVRQAKCVCVCVSHTALAPLAGAFTHRMTVSIGESPQFVKRARNSLHGTSLCGRGNAGRRLSVP